MTESADSGPSELHAALHTRACDLFGVRYPVVQTGMGYVSNSQLRADASITSPFAAQSSDSKH
jgi:NAD(P)H-dependent flavin oxidoreductase YrpB (nitropropane dioxygenase family)